MYTDALTTNTNKVSLPTPISLVTELFFVLFRTTCDRRHMEYADRGSTVRDAKCRCSPGYHFLNSDHTHCVGNTVCPVGKGQTDYGKSNTPSLILQK